MPGGFTAPENFLVSWLRAPTPRGVSAPLGDVISLGTRIGKKIRRGNEDRVLLARFADARGMPADVCVVCDGMGGMAAGDRCAELGSALFVLALAASLAAGRVARAALIDAVTYANRRVWDEYGGSGGTTLAALLMHDGLAWACTAGDTRVYAGGAGPLRQLSSDDTMEGALEAVRGRGAMADPGDPDRQRLVQFVGMGPDFEPHTFVVEHPNDYRFLLICSDGAYRPPGNLFAGFVSEAPNPRGLVERLLSVAEWAGGVDDASVAAIDARAVEKYTPHDDSLRGVVKVWGPGAGQAAVLLNFTRETWPRWIVDRRNVAAHTGEELPDQAELLADFTRRVAAANAAADAKSQGSQTTESASRPEAKNGASGGTGGKKKKKKGAAAKQHPLPLDREVVIEVRPGRVERDAEEDEDGGDEDEPSMIDPRSRTDGTRRGGS